jgi:hypothetical protein
MARLRVHIRLDRLRAHLAAEDKEPKTELDVLTWLADARFIRGDGPWWLVDEPDLGQLRPSEVAGVEDAITIGVTAPAVEASSRVSDDAVEAA